MALFKKSNKPKVEKQGAWKVLIVDDEPDVHTVTKITLSDFEFDGKSIDFVSAYSGEEAKKIMAEHGDIALVLLDVVMETDDAGLQVAEFIRKALNNHLTRIILRTGQPGQAPERTVIVNYDINDYKDKTHLSSDKLFTVVYTGLRGYRDIQDIETARKKLETHRQGLEQVIDSTTSLFRIRSLREFASGLLVQISTLLHANKPSAQSNNFAVRKSQGRFEYLAGNGEYGFNTSDYLDLPEHILALLEKACEQQKSLIEHDCFVGYFKTYNAEENLIYLQGITAIDELDTKLLELFSNNITVAFDNLELDKEIYDTQSEIIETLGEVVESRSKEAANHVKRVAHLSRALALWIGLPNAQAQELFMAAPMHDVGKVAIPDSVLLKPGKLDDEQWHIMKTHVSVGQEIFSRSKRPTLKAAAIVAGEHHEKFDGSGYPNGLSGEDIHIYGRIVALVDVFDALSHKRCYKDAWSMDEVLALLVKEKGRHFDPQLVDVFIEHIDDVQSIMDKYPD
ncbi:histidine kinase [Pseudoalteromonas luteoviolacea]|uniref:Histidine kinase n=1 Tax=Pseudoalteromonas luteoviolacea TaxID=43657 RepID=A0A0C1Q3I3_9GAMM|nr:DUF3369 domain-containing protein [Pseudoalteromonas luteoviolacea]KID55146.1 histidine kinase [Pseudoalteromonas luteoviolacea]